MAEQSEYVRVPFADSTLGKIPEEVSDEKMIIIRLYNTCSNRSSSNLRNIGLCAILTAKVLGAGTVYAVDSVDDRLEEARKMGARPLNLGTDDIPGTIKSATNGRGADAVVESVGNKSAMRLAFDLVRPCGVLSSIGFHQGSCHSRHLKRIQRIWKVVQGYIANSMSTSINMGRAAVRPVFGEAVKVFTENQDKFADFITHRMPLADAALGYEIFEKDI
ncbi:uncharacterized protein N7469_011188 [Penicillium citrinum]|uniref:Alcohol dehydrogenase-like C-terminal domain-containing protein n=1 Tax=Penicillium citrinum TaxID=5077 RepID=A0A9W9TCE0_PENCI|nr:uncharacterized protein N7469_011188 [Penicillium citrinum]KAJ5217563.1 hypothetical protein N7469_011188 [Penicillium citrinum]